MREPTSGEQLFAERLFATERKSSRLEAPSWWPHVFNLAVVCTFLFFLFM
jgi:hypothetical protein